MRLEDITYFIVDNDVVRPQYIFLDMWEEMNTSLSSNITDNPIDALGGASLQDRRAVDMIGIQVSGAFSNRNQGRRFNLPDADILFLSDYRRLESIVHWFDIAIENSTVFTVCRRGVLFHNQLLNSVEWIFDESQSKIGVNFSFVEVEHFENISPERSSTVLELPQFPIVEEEYEYEEEEYEYEYEYDSNGNLVRTGVAIAAAFVIGGPVVGVAVAAVSIFRRLRRR